MNFFMAGRFDCRYERFTTVGTVDIGNLLPDGNQPNATSPVERLVQGSEESQEKFAGELIS